MKGTKLAILLGIAAAAVGMQNYIYFSSLAEAPVAVDDDDEDEADDWDSDERRALGLLNESDLVAWSSARSNEPLRNPFLTREEEDLLGSSLTTISVGLPRVTGTLWSQDRRVAWIGGRAVSEGDWVGEYKILRIESTRVALSRAEGENPMILSVANATSPREEESHD